VGIVMQGSEDYRSASWRGRLGVIGLTAAFIVWSVVLLVRRGAGWIGIGGLALALTPAVVFLSSNVSISGIEIAASICLWVALLGLARRPGNVSGAPWAAVAVSGAVMGLARPVDSVLLVIIVGLVVLLVGFRGARAIVAGAKAKALVAGAVLVVCAGASALWSMVVTPEPGSDLGTAIRALDDTARDAPNHVRQVIGIFGWNDTAMPQPVYVMALLVLAVVMVGAFWIGGRRDRLTFGALAASVVVVHFSLAVLVEPLVVFGTQARYVLPLVVGLPLLAGDVLAVRRSALRPDVIRYGVPLVFVVWGLLHFTAFTVNAHRYALGASGGWSIPWDGLWSPVGGFALWFSFAGAGCVLLIAAGLLSLGDGSKSSESVNADAGRATATPV
jgi:hypothetical protein